MKFASRFLALLLLFGFSTLAFAQTVSINAGNQPYRSLPALGSNVGVGSMAEVRIAALTAAASAYRAQFGIMAMTKLRIGDRFKLTYKDGTSETAEVVSQTMTEGAVPVPGTQRNADGSLVGSTGGSTGGGGGGGTGGGAYWGVIGYTPIYATGTVCVGSVCETQTQIVGYEPVYGWIGTNRER